MVSNEMLLTVHMRLCELYDPGQPFGGVNVLLFGDLLQLPPVNTPFVFESFNAAQSGFVTSLANVVDLWRLFDYDELTQNVRQIGRNIQLFVVCSLHCNNPQQQGRNTYLFEFTGDDAYADLLGRVRVGCLNEEDVVTLSSRLITPSGVRASMSEAVEFFSSTVEGPGNGQTVCLFPTCALVEQFNMEMMAKLNFTTVDIEAILGGQQNQPTTKRAKAKAKKAATSVKGRKTRETAGLERLLRLAVGARVMLRRNLNQAVGLVNGAIGVVRCINYMHDNTVSSVIVDFASCGQMNVRIDRVKADFEVGRDVFIEMAQFPLCLSYALTIHKSQMSFIVYSTTSFIGNNLPQFHSVKRTEVSMELGDHMCDVCLVWLKS